MHTLPLLFRRVRRGTFHWPPRNFLRGVALVAMLLLAERAEAQFYFDVTSGSGLGTATSSNSWNSTIWNNNDATGNSTREAWTNGNVAVFNAGSGTYTANITTAGTTVSGVTVSQGTVTISTSGSGSLAMSANSTFNVASNLTVSAVIGGAFSLTKTGGGTLTLSGNNNYTGDTNIGTSGGASGGTLAIGAANRIPGTTVNIYGGTLSLGAFAETIGALNLGGGATGTTASVTGTGTLTLGGNVTFSATNNANGATIASGVALAGNRTFTINDSTNAADDLTISGVVSNGSGTRAVIKAGAGTLVMSANNTYTGATTINGGTLSVGTVANGSTASGLGASTNAAANLVLNNGTLKYTGGNASTNRNFTITAGSTGTIEVSTAATSLTISGAAASTSGAFTKTGAGTLVLSGNNAYSGLTTITAGTLKLGTAGSGGNGPLGTTGAGTVVSSGGALDLGGFTLANAEALTINGTGVSSGGSLTNSGSAATFSGAVTLGSAASIGGSGNITLSTGLAGNFLLTKVGSNTVFLNGSAGSRTGGAQLDAGTLQLGNAAALGSGSQNLTLNGGTLDLAIDSTTNAYNTLVGGNVTINSNKATNGSSGITHTLGTLSIGGNTLTVADGANVSNNSAFGLTFGATSITGNSTFNVGNNGTGTGTLTLGALNGGGAARTLTKTGAGTLALSAAASSWTDSSNAVVNNGTLQVSASNALGSTALTNVTVNAMTAGTTATFATGSSANQSIKSLTIGGSGATSTSTNNVTIGSGSTLTLGGNVTYDATNNPLGATISGSGTLALGTATRTFNIADSTNAANDLTVSTNISGTGGLIKTGAGTLQLSGSASTFNGSNNSGLGITVSQGTLLGYGTTNLGGFKALGDYSALATATDVISVTSGATLAVQSSYTADDGNGTTTSFQNLVLNGSGVNGGGALRAVGGNSTWTGNTVLNSNTTITNSVAGTANELFLGAFVFNTDSTLKLNGNTLTLNGPGDIYISSKIGNLGGDTGSVVINGANNTSTVTFSGYANTYTGATTVNSGQLYLRMNPANPTNSGILGNLTIGSNSDTTTAKVIVRWSEQIANSSLVTINADGTLDLTTHGTLEVIKNLNLNGGNVVTGAGELHLDSTGGLVTVATGGSVSSPDSNSTISGKFRFLGTSGTFDVAANNTLLLSANLFGTDFTKTGTGTMIMTFDNNSNGYTGVTTVGQGILNLRNSGALGAISSGTVVNSGATLQLEKTSTDVQVGAESLTIAGTGVGGVGALNSLSGADNRYGGAVTLSDNAKVTTTSGNLLINGSVKGTAASSFTQTLTVGGGGSMEIHGSIQNGANGGTLNLTKIDGGTLTLSGANSFTGAVDVQAGTVVVNANAVLGSNVNTVAVSSDAIFSVTGGNNYSNTISKLTGSGLVSIAASTNLVVNNTVADTFDGRLSGSGLFEKTGAETFTFSSTANTSAFNFGGTVKVSEGTMEFAGGSAANALTISNLTLLGGTTIYLNASYINVGTLTISGHTILDFGTGGASVLNATNIYIAAGGSLTVKNWTSEVDFLFATNSGYATSGGFRLDNSSGTLATFNQIGSAPENKVKFENTNSADGSHTTWINNNYEGFTNWEIRPIPEPSTYGFILVGSALALIGFKRYRRNTTQR